MATAAEHIRKKGNLRVLQRLDQSILDIEGTASHVVLYEFDVSAGQWQKKDTEGSLFLVKRSEAPRFTLIILNRNSVNNWTLPITYHGFQMQNSDPYLIFKLRQKQQEQPHQDIIRGIWFHDSTERENIATVIGRVLVSLKHVAEIEADHKPISMNTNGSNNQQTQLEQSAHTSNQQSDNKEFDKDAAAAALLSSLTLGSGNKADKSSSNNDNIQQQQQLHQQTPPPTSQQHQQLVLDKRSLQLSLMSLIQDERFIDLIHAQYLKVAHARANRNKSPSSRKQSPS